MTSTSKHLLGGKQAELLAENYLKKQKLKLLEKNYRSRYGEIDLIFNDKGTIVFVEVRLRSNAQFASASESVDYYKQKKIIATAKHYLLQHPDSACRFDLVVLDRLDIKRLDWIKSAFDASGFD